jgi:hypothetical protein
MSVVAPSNSWLRAQRKSDLVELADSLGFKKYVLLLLLLLSTLLLFFFFIFLSYLMLAVLVVV